MKLYCKNCNEKLTPNALSEAELDLIDLREEEDLIPKGMFIEANKIRFEFGVEIKYILNIDSVRLQNHKEITRLQGCCGPSNFDALNQVCPKCSSEIGVISGDCCMPHFVGIAENAVSLLPLW